MRSIELPTQTIYYSVAHGPGREVVRGSVVRMNCQAWAHEALRGLGVWLPLWMRSREIAEDMGAIVRTVTAGEPLKAGDIFLFAGPQTRDSKYLHLAVHSGLAAPLTREPILTHATVITGTVSAWPLSWFAHEPRYAQLVAVKRPVGLG